MGTGYVLYNPLAGTGKGATEWEHLQLLFEEPLHPRNLTLPETLPRLRAELKKEDFLILCGGDGTLNRFINDTEEWTLPDRILYLPSGSGNDFARELGRTGAGGPFPIGDYLKNLPKVTVRGETRRFLNGVGFGIDGYCCLEGDRLRQKGKRKINYTAIAVRGLLFRYRPTNATVTVDGKRRQYEKVWIAPTMKGTCYGGGMFPTPGQDRTDPEGKLSVLILHGTGKWKTLFRFPSLFRGEHLQYGDMAEVLTGSRITVEFDRPSPLQIDGETVRDVTGYTAFASAVSQKKDG